MSRGPLATLSKGRRLDRGSMLRISGRRDGVFRTGRMEAEGFGHAGQWNRGVTSALHIPATNHQPPTTNHRPRSSTCKYVQVCTGTEYEASSKYGYYEEVLRTEHAVVCEDGSKLSVLRTSANPCFSSRANHIRWPLITTYTPYIQKPVWPWAMGLGISYTAQSPQGMVAAASTFLLRITVTIAEYEYNSVPGTSADSSNYSVRVLDTLKYQQRQSH
jgi:hypothetical protein